MLTGPTMYKTNGNFQQQSTRGDNQNRPGSSGFGPASGATTANATSATFPVGAEGANNVLAGQQVEAEHDGGAYVYGGGHNGATGGEGYQVFCFGFKLTISDDR